MAARCKPGKPGIVLPVPLLPFPQSTRQEPERRMHPCTGGFQARRDSARWPPNVERLARGKSFHRSRLVGHRSQAERKPHGANQWGPVNFRSARLPDASLRFATLSGADLEAADMSHADLTHARLDRANLTAANLRNALLGFADLAGARLTQANLCGANLQHAKNLTQAEIEACLGSNTTILPPPSSCCSRLVAKNHEPNKRHPL